MTDKLNATERAVIRGLGMSEEEYIARRGERAAARRSPSRAERVAVLRKLATGGAVSAAARDVLLDEADRIEGEDDDG